jgi:two-component system chemotaxis response regulator CheY
MGKTILVVDDSASVRQVVSIALKGAGYDVIQGSDGKDALKQLDGKRIHLIISDVNMPNMDGITFVTEAKKLPAYKFTPVIMLTTESQEEKKRQEFPRLLAAVEKSTTVRVGLAGVTEMDTAGLQLLLAVRRAAERLGGAAEFHDASDPVREALAILQLDDELRPVEATR